MADRIHIVMVGSEAVPFAKVGGLGDILGALPRQLERLGADATVIIPRHKVIDLDKFGFQACPLPDNPRVPLGFEHIPFDVHEGVLPGSSVRVFLIGNDRFFNRDGIYLDTLTGKDYPDQADRWIVFQRAAMDFIRTALPRVEILHCHDHQTGLMPAYLRKFYRSEPVFASSGSVFTIHNLGYQGLFPRDVMARTGFNDAEFYPTSPFEFYGKLNFMKVGIVYSDVVTTVSEGYAREILQGGEFSFGLEGVLQERPDPPVGILNGIDYDVWNPETDPLIPARYSVDRLDGKRENKRLLLQEFGLDDSRIDKPLLAMISRIEVQKGFDLVVSVLDDILAQDVSFVLLGTGNKETESYLRSIVERHAGKASMRFGYDDSFAHRIEAGADIFLMPSKYEPCGLNQMYSMRYGTVPVVRATGGLADTVEEFDPATGEGTGFRFLNYDAREFRQAIERALSVWKDRDAWARVQANGMRADFSWARSARRYMEVYEGLLNRRQS